MRSKTIFALALAAAALLLLAVTGASTQGTLHPKKKIWARTYYSTRTYLPRPGKPAQPATARG